MPTVAILDDHPAVLAGLRRLIDGQADLTVVAAAASAPELAIQLDGTRPDALVLDYDLGGDGLAHCRRIKDRRHPPAVLIYSAYTSAALTLAARAAQADGVVDKAEPVPALLTAIRRIVAGESVMPPVPRDVREAAVARVDDTDLSLLAMLLAGEAPAAIADALHADRAEVTWRAQRIIARLRPRASGGGGGTPLPPPAHWPYSSHAADATAEQPSRPGAGSDEQARRGPHAGRPGDSGAGRA